MKLLKTRQGLNQHFEIAQGGATKHFSIFVSEASNRFLHKTSGLKKFAFGSLASLSQKSENLTKKYDIFCATLYCGFSGRQCLKWVYTQLPRNFLSRENQCIVFALRGIS